MNQHNADSLGTAVDGLRFRFYFKILLLALIGNYKTKIPKINIISVKNINFCLGKVV